MRDYGYDIKYSQDDYFNNRKWINDIYVKSLIRKSNIPMDSWILDVGCGQGYFSHLLNTCGMDVLGIDLSETGIRQALSHYKSNKLHFIVGDAFNAPVLIEFDCVFARALSLYNTDNVEQIRSITRILMEHVKPNGLFIFLYSTNFHSRKWSDTWRHHNLDDIMHFFSDYQDKLVYFSSKVDCLLFGKLAFNKVFSYMNMFASRIFGLGGELVCFIRK